MHLIFVDILSNHFVHCLFYKPAAKMIHFPPETIWHKKKKEIMNAEHFQYYLDNFWRGQVS